MDNILSEREYIRIPVKVAVDTELISSGRKHAGTTQDISMKGFFIDSSDTFPVDSQCRITLLIGGPESEARVWVKAKVVYANPSGMGVQILSHLSLESYGHLYRLVLYNAADRAPQVEAEIQANLKK